MGSKIGRIFEYWTRWKCLEVTPTTAPYFRANRSLYKERLGRLQGLRDEIVVDANLCSSYRDTLLREVFDSITILGRPNVDSAEEMTKMGIAYAGGVLTGVVGKEIVSSLTNPNKNQT